MPLNAIYKMGMALTQFQSGESIGEYKAGGLTCLIKQDSKLLAGAGLLASFAYHSRYCRGDLKATRCQLRAAGMQ